MSAVDVPRPTDLLRWGLLRVCWSGTDGICSKRMAPFLPELLERLRSWHALRHVLDEAIERVAHMSPATIDRALAPSRDGLPKRGLSATRPGTLLKQQLAIKTFADWTEAQPPVRRQLMGRAARDEVPLRRQSERGQVSGDAAAGRRLRHRLRLQTAP